QLLIFDRWELASAIGRRLRWHSALAASLTHRRAALDKRLGAYYPLSHHHSLDDGWLASALAFAQAAGFTAGSREVDANDIGRIAIVDTLHPAPNPRTVPVIAPQRTQSGCRVSAIKVPILRPRPLHRLLRIGLDERDSFCRPIRYLSHANALRRAVE